MNRIRLGLFFLLSASSLTSFACSSTTTVTALPRDGGSPEGDSSITDPPDNQDAGASDDAAKTDSGGSVPAFAWTAVKGAPSGDVQSVWGSSLTDVWSIVDGSLAHFDGSQWVSWGGTGLTRVWGRTASDVYVGGDGTLQHFDGTTWKDEGVTTGTVRDVAATNTDRWVVGEYIGAGSLRHGDPSSWNFGDGFDPPSGYSSQLYSVAAVASWAWVGGDNFALEWNGSQWSTLMSGTAPVLGLYAASPTDVFMITGGYFGTASLDSQILWKVPDGSFGPQMAEQDVPSVTLHGIAGHGSKDVWVVGDKGTVLRFDGSNWTNVTVPTSHDLHSVWVTSTSKGTVVWAGGAGALFQYAAAK